MNTVAPTWIVDPKQSKVKFSIKHLMFSKVNGEFHRFSGTLILNREKPSESSLTASAEVGSIDTQDEKRDQHLKGTEFFNAEKFPLMTYRSNRISESGESFKVEGQLTLRDETQAVTFVGKGLSRESKDPFGNPRILVTAQAKINRKDFGLTWNAAIEAGGVLVGDEVSIDLQLQLIQISSKPDAP